MGDIFCLHQWDIALRSVRAWDGVLHLGCLSQSFRDEYYFEAYGYSSYCRASIQYILYMVRLNIRGKSYVKWPVGA